MRNSCLLVRTPLLDGLYTISKEGAGWQASVHVGKRGEEGEGGARELC